MKFITLTNGMRAAVDDADHDRLSAFEWKAQKGHGTYYAYRRRNGQCVYMHREIMGTPNGLVTDHIDHDGLNNTRANLRACTQSQNMMNRRGARPESRCGLRGVYFRKQRNKWQARICVNGKKKYLGHFDTPEEASRAYAAGNAKYFGQFGGALA